MLVVSFIDERSAKGTFLVLYLLFHNTCAAFNLKLSVTTQAKPSVLVVFSGCPRVLVVRSGHFEPSVLVVISSDQSILVVSFLSTRVQHKVLFLCFKLIVSILNTCMHFSQVIFGNQLVPNHSGELTSSKIGQRATHLKFEATRNRSACQSKSWYETAGPLVQRKNHSGEKTTT